MNKQKKISLILIDDDPLVHKIWKIKSEQLPSTTFHSYKNIEEFTSSAILFQKSAYLFIDFNIQGEQLKKEKLEYIKKLGFSNLYIISGYIPDSLVGAFIGEVMGIRNKEFPFDLM